MIAITFKDLPPTYEDSTNKLARISNSSGCNVRLRDGLRNALWQSFKVSWFPSRNEHGQRIPHLPVLISLTGQEWDLLPRSWTVEQQSLPYQESSCDYCNANQPVITLRACQAFDGALCEPPFSSMWPPSRQEPHPVRGLHLNSLQKEYADWDIHPPAIVPLLISSHRAFPIWAIHRSYWVRTSRSDLKFQKEKALSDLCRSELQHVVTRWIILGLLSDRPRWQLQITFVTKQEQSKFEDNLWILI